MRGCPVRYRCGPDRDCGQHAEIGGALAERMTAMGIDAPPRGRHDDGGDGGGGRRNGGG